MKRDGLRERGCPRLKLRYCQHPKDDFYGALTKIKGIVAKPILTEEELDLLDSKAGHGPKPLRRWL